MKIRIKVGVGLIVKIFIITFMIMQLSFTKLLGNSIELFSTSYVSKELALLYVGIIVLVTVWGGVQKKVKIPVYLKIESIILIFSLCLSIIFSMSEYSMKLGDTLTYSVRYLNVLIAIPLFVLIIRQFWTLDNCLKTVVCLTMGSYILRAGISFIYGLSGKIIFENIALESAVANWVRDGVLRINPPCFALYFVTIVFYLYSKETKKSKKIVYIICIVSSILYTIIIQKGRSLLIYQVLTIVIMFLIQKKNSTNKFARILIILIGIVTLINTEWFSSLLDSFYISNNSTGGSTVLRLNAILYFGIQYLQKPFTGIGFLPFENRIAMGGGDISDIGILYSVFMMGIPMVVFYVIMLGRGWYAVYKSWNLSEKYILVFGMTLIIMLTLINVDCFYSVFAFAVPFYIAVVEYVLWEIKKKKEPLNDNLEMLSIESKL